MANEKHIEILRQGVEVWNKWREDNPEVRPDLIGATFLRVNLEGANLSGANLANARVSSTSFSNVQLNKATELDTVKHYGPSTVGTDTLHLCQGKLPEEFLKG